MKREVDIFKKESTIYIVSKKKTLAGLNIFHDVMFKVAINNIELIGEKTLDALNAYIENAPHPTKEKINTLSNPLLILANEEDEKKFYSSVAKIFVNYYEEDNRFEIIPTSNDGWEKGFGFSSKKNLNLKLENLNTKDLGKAILECFDRCESKN